MAPPDTAQRPPHLRLRSALLWSAVALFALWCAASLGRDILQIEPSRLSDQWALVAGAGALSLLNYFLRAVRWGFYLRRLGHALPWGFVGTTFMAGLAFTLSPGKLGEVIRVRYYAPEGVSLSQVSGAFFVERLLDLMALTLLAMLVVAQGDAPYRQVIGLAALLVLVLLVIAAGVRWEQIAVRTPHPAREPSGWRGLPARALGKVARILTTVRALLSPAALATGLILALAAWGAEAYGLKLLCDAASPHPLPVGTAMSIYAVALLVGALSFLPGGLGSTEAVMAALLSSNGLSIPDALLVTLACRVLTLWLAVIIGWGCVLRLERRRVASDVPRGSKT